LTCSTGNNSCILECDSGCLKCENNSANCLSCKAGFYQNGSSCEACNNTVCATCNTNATTCVVSCKAGCATCNTSGDCISCANGKYLSSGKCLLCSYKCATCSESATNCTTCSHSSRNLSLSSCPCNDGFYDDGSNQTC